MRREEKEGGKQFSCPGRPELEKETGREKSLEPWRAGEDFSVVPCHALHCEHLQYSVLPKLQKKICSGSRILF